MARALITPLLPFVPVTVSAMPVFSAAAVKLLVCVICV